METPLFFSLLLLEFLAFASCDTCLPPEDIAPCACGYPVGVSGIDCNGVNLKEMDEAFDNIRGKTIESVYIRNVKGDRLSSLLFWNTHVRYVYILSCDLRGLSESDTRPAFIGLESSLEKLSVSTSIKGENQLKRLDLSHLKNLENIWLYENNISEVGNDWFAKDPLRMKYVSIVSCGLSKIGNRAFATLVNLQVLSLWDNRLTSIDRSMMPNPAPYLRELDLHKNNITRLSKDIFSGMPSLQDVLLKANLIRRIEGETWSSIWEKLNRLDLTNNPLECDSHMEWMFSLKRPKTLLGTCASPESVKGERLLYFIEINRKLLSLAGKSSGSSSKKELHIG